MLQQTQGIVLKTFKYSETSLIVRIYTEKLGLQSYLINRVRHKKAKIKPALLQGLSVLDMVVYHRQNKNIQHIKELKLAYVFSAIPFDTVRSSIALFIAATSALTISSSVNGGENDMGGLKEWNTDMELDADFVLDKDAQKIADEAAKSSTCIPIGEGENCW